MTSVNSSVENYTFVVYKKNKRFVLRTDCTTLKHDITSYCFQRGLALHLLPRRFSFWEVLILGCDGDHWHHITHALSICMFGLYVISKRVLNGGFWFGFYIRALGALLPSFAPHLKMMEWKYATALGRKVNWRQTFPTTMRIQWEEPWLWVTGLA